MKTLLIDTATPAGSVALFEDNRFLGEIIFNTQLAHLQTLHIAIRDLLKNLKTEIKEINLIGVDIGPGSFTGVRIGITTAKTFSQILKIGIEGVNSLMILAYKFPLEEYIICPIIDGKKERVYTALFRKNNKKLENLTGYYDINPEKLVNIIKEQFGNEKIVFLGDGQIKYKEYIKSKLKNCEFTDENFYYPSAHDIFYLIKKENFNKDYNKIEPFYLRKSDAEENFKTGL